MNRDDLKLNQLLNNKFFFGDSNPAIRITQTLLFILFFSLLGWLFFPTPKSLGYWGLYFLASLFILANAFYAGSKYIQDIYEIEGLSYAIKYLLIVFFGIGIPRANISGGKKNFSGKFDFIQHIGGPCIFQIERDNVVVIETLQNSKDVLVAGKRRLTRYDFVKDILSTEEQYEEIDEIKSLTADGITVFVRNVQIRFRIDGFFLPDLGGRKTIAYLPLNRAVKDLAYQKNIPEDGKITAWTNDVIGAVKGIIRGHINNSYLDDLISPREAEGHSLDKLRHYFESSQTKERFKRMGVRFDSCNIGEIDVPALNMDKEHLKMWFVKQEGSIKVLRAQSDSESFASQERGRAEGQVMLLRSITRALQEVGGDGQDPVAVRKNLRNILLTRTAQILESRTSIYKTYKEDNKNDHKGKL